MTAPVCYVDTETISLNRDFRHLWEIALIIPGYCADGSDLEKVWTLRDVPLGEADSYALNVGHFRERYDARTATDPRTVAAEVSRLTWRLHLVGAVVSFDELRLEQFLRAHNQAPGWHYHLVDCEALAAGKLGIAPPWRSDDLTAALGINTDGMEKHTALGDARWAKAIYEAVLPNDHDDAGAVA